MLSGEDSPRGNVFTGFFPEKNFFSSVNKMSVDTLSDSELRSKLMEYGFPVGPVTQTTRKILVKKLKSLIEARGGSGSRHSLAAR